MTRMAEDRLRELVQTRPGERFLVLPGEDSDPARRGERTVYAVTHVTIPFSNVDDLVSCFSQLCRSDDRLQADPTAKYNWVNTYAQGLKLIFGVAWYDKSFYLQKRETYLRTDHLEMFSSFNVAPSELEIVHEVRGELS